MGTGASFICKSNRWRRCWGATELKMGGGVFYFHFNLKSGNKIKTFCLNEDESGDDDDDDHN